MSIVGVQVVAARLVPEVRGPCPVSWRAYLSSVGAGIAMHALVASAGVAPRRHLDL
jgi:hypothetical protein